MNITAHEWFSCAEKRGGPHPTAAFNIHGIPRTDSNIWAHAVAINPWGVRCVEVKITALSQAVSQLFETIKSMYSVASEQAVKLFDEYLTGECPACFHRLNGNSIQLVAGLSKMTVVVGGNAFTRMLEGRCTNCASEALYLVWHGDNSCPVEDAVRPTAPSDPIAAAATNAMQLLRAAGFDLNWKGMDGRTPDLQLFVKALRYAFNLGCTQPSSEKYLEMTHLLREAVQLRGMREMEWKPYVAGAVRNSPDAPLNEMETVVFAAVQLAAEVVLAARK